MQGCHIYSISINKHFLISGKLRQKHYSYKTIPVYITYKKSEQVCRLSFCDKCLEIDILRPRVRQWGLSLVYESPNNSRSTKPRGFSKGIHTEIDYFLRHSCTDRVLSHFAYFFIFQLQIKLEGLILEKKGIEGF